MEDGDSSRVFVSLFLTRSELGRRVGQVVGNRLTGALEIDVSNHLLIVEQRILITLSFIDNYIIILFLPTYMAGLSRFFSLYPLCGLVICLRVAFVKYFLVHRRPLIQCFLDKHPLGIPVFYYRAS